MTTRQPDLYMGVDLDDLLNILDLPRSGLVVTLDASEHHHIRKAIRSLGVDPHQYQWAKISTLEKDIRGRRFYAYQFSVRAGENDFADNIKIVQRGLNTSGGRPLLAPGAHEARSKLYQMVTHGAIGVPAGAFTNATITSGKIANGTITTPDTAWTQPASKLLPILQLISAAPDHPVLGYLPDQETRWVMVRKTKSGSWTYADKLLADVYAEEELKPTHFIDFPADMSDFLPKQLKSDQPASKSVTADDLLADIAKMKTKMFSVDSDNYWNKLHADAYAGKSIRNMIDTQPIPVTSAVD